MDMECAGTNWRRHPEFWFSDGSIILVARGTAFRVHKTFLGRKSEVFRDMFALAQPELSSFMEAEDASSDVDISPAVVQGHQLEGCPVVCLHGDSPVDVEHLLYALYDGP